MQGMGQHAQCIARTHVIAVHPIAPDSALHSGLQPLHVLQHDLLPQCDLIAFAADRCTGQTSLATRE